jgi:iron complex outermembrane receptor protein
MDYVAIGDAVWDRRRSHGSSAYPRPTGGYARQACRAVHLSDGRARLALKCEPGGVADDASASVFRVSPFGLDERECVACSVQSTGWPSQATVVMQSTTQGRPSQASVRRMQGRSAALGLLLSGMVAWGPLSGVAAQTAAEPPAVDAGTPPPVADAALPPGAAAEPEPPPPPAAPVAESEPLVVPAPDIAAAELAAESSSEPVAEFGASAVARNPFERVTLEEVPRNAQQVGGDALTNHDGVGLHNALNQRLGSATINDVQNNPLQPDFQYRGFTASPLLGTPQGLAVYQNGVRINEPFGDVLQWDLIPSFAIANATVVPGADPIYGLNALGGSLVLETKDGFRAPGIRVEGLTGMFSRYLTTAEYGHSWGPWALYAGASVFGEQGYRDHSPSSAQNLFFDIRNRTPDREVGVSVTAANTSLNGNGPAPTQLIQEDREALYTWPDNTRNQLLMLSVDAKQRLSDKSSLLANAYLRHGARNTLNGDEAEFSSCAGDAGETLLCDEDGERLQDESGVTIPTAQPFNAVYNRTQTTSDGLGALLQFDVRAPLARRPNHFLAGASYDGSHVGFLQSVEVGRLTLDRGVQGSGLKLGGDDYRTELEIQNHAVGVFASDLWRVAGPLAIQASARLNVLNTRLEDQQGDALNGNHTFVRVNPSLGVLLDVHDGTTLFANYSESNRAPNASELTCADPTQPCRLPNAFVADPPLDQVVSRSVELGVRTRLGERAHPWLEGSFALFGSRNQDDILFVAGGLVGTGYFRNAGATQRIGLEAAVATHTGPVEFYASYTLLRATFEDDLELPGTANPFASGGGGDDDDDDQSGGVLDVKKGSRVPGLPTHAIKAGVSVRPIKPLELGISGIGQSSQPFRGDEGNFLRGVDGFFVLSAHASYQVLEPLKLYVRATNLLDTKFSTFGVIADPSEVLPQYSNPRFLGRGAPFGIWVGAVVTEVP